MKNIINTKLCVQVAMQTQEIILFMRKSSIIDLRLVPEPNNKFDSEAVAVFAPLPSGAKKIGYLMNRTWECKNCKRKFEKKKPENCICNGIEFKRCGLASFIFNEFSKGSIYTARVNNYTGPEILETDINVGVNIQLIEL